LQTRHFFCYNGGMTLIGMPEAARRAGMTPDGIRRALMNAGVRLTRINAKAVAVDESALADFVRGRGVSPGRGRPLGAKNRPKGQAGMKAEF